MHFDLSLYAITDSSYNKIPLSAQLEAAINGGASIIQLREKLLSEGEYIKKAEEALQITKKHNIPLIINDSPIVAVKSGADGVHLGQSDGSVEDARILLGSNAIIGVTAKTLKQALKAEADGADYLGCGAVFTSPTKPDAASISLALLREICEAVHIPVCAIGGINHKNAYLLKGTGISGIAAVSSVFGSENSEGIYNDAKRLKLTFSESINE